MGRTASGVKGIDFDRFVDKVVGMENVENPDNKLLIVTENGYGKKTIVEEFRLTHRGSKGVKALNITEKNGKMVTLQCVDDDNDAMIITDSGTIIRISLDQVSTLKRATQGVRLINLKDNQKVASVTKIAADQEESSENDENE